jgi:hypothetical protein
MRRRRVEQRRRALRQQIRDQAVLVDRDAGDLGAGGFEGQRGAAIAGILDHAQRAARQIKPGHHGKAFLDA